MILNISGRTDIVQYYTEWLLNGFDAGFVYSRNPMFCSKNYKPTFPHLERFAHKFNAYFHYMITTFGKEDVEPGATFIYSPATSM